MRCRTPPRPSRTFSTATVVDIAVGTAAAMAIAATAARASDPVLVAGTSVMAEDVGTAMAMIVVMAVAVSTKNHWRPAEAWGALWLRPNRRLLCVEIASCQA
jgi:hypothetical protein